METKAHHVLIGAFTLVVIALLLVFALWLGKTSLNKQHHYYDIVFTEAVTGLSKGSAVQYNGIQVGEVSQLKLDANDPRKVLARIQVAADTPIKMDTRAKLGLLGVTGVAFVQLSGGAPDSPPLMPTARDPVPVIKSESSALSKLLAGGGDVMTSLNGILDRLGQILSKKNVAHVNNMFENLDATTTTLAAERNNLATLIRQLTAASTELSKTLTSANRLLNGPGQQTLERAATAMTSLQQATKTLNQVVEDNQGSVQAGLRGMDQIGPALRQLRVTLHDLQEVTDSVKANPAGFLLGHDRPTQFNPKH